MSESEVIMDSRWIQSILPHRYPFLLVDRVIELEAGKTIRAIKNVTVNEEYFNGHFPGHPVVPGVLIIEGLAQAGGILLLHDNPNRENMLNYFSAIDRARFRRPVVPGDQLVYEVEIARLRSSFAKMSAVAKVDGKVVAEGTLSSSMVLR